MTERVLLFDGVCNLCNASVQFIIKNDPSGKIKLTSLQSESGQSLLEAHNLSKTKLFSLVLIHENQLFLRSEAVLQIARVLRQPWPVFYKIGRFVPRFFRDKLYDLISKFRYKIFGKRNECMIPSRDLMDRFLK
jgi:predicted DCC family thiol-disulfide oxidoreductase YuxK